MRTTKAQISETKKIIFTLLVIIVLIVGVGKIFGRAKDNVQDEFDPDKFFNLNQGSDDEALASSLLNALSLDQQKNAQDIVYDAFANPYYGEEDSFLFNKGRLVLLSSLSSSDSLFKEQEDIGIIFQQAGQHVVIYLVKTIDGLEQKSLFKTYEDTPYLKFKQLCFLPLDVNAPLLSTLSNWTAVDQQNFPDGITLENVAEKNTVHQIKFMPLITQAGPLKFTTTVVSSSEKKELTQYALHGQPVWITDNTICFFQQSGEVGSGGGLRYDVNNAGQSIIKGKNTALTHDLIIKLTEHRVLDSPVIYLMDRI